MTAQSMAEGHDDSTNLLAIIVLNRIRTKLDPVSAIEIYYKWRRKTNSK